MRLSTIIIFIQMVLLVILSYYNDTANMLYLNANTRYTCNKEINTVKKMYYECTKDKEDISSKLFKRTKSELECKEDLRKIEGQNLLLSIGHRNFKEEVLRCYFYSEDLKDQLNECQSKNK